MNLEEVRENGDCWRPERLIYSMELIYERQKYVSGDFNRWITRFEDKIETCGTVGVNLSVEARVNYFMNNLNDTIFGEMKATS